MHEKTKGAASTTEIILYDSYVIVYKNSADVFFYLVGDPEENEILLSMILSAFFEAISGLLN